MMIFSPSSFCFCNVSTVFFILISFFLAIVIQLWYIIKTLFALQSFTVQTEQAGADAYGAGSQTRQWISYIRGTVVANITEYVGVFFLENLPIYSLTEISNKNSKRMCHRATANIFYFRR